MTTDNDNTPKQSEQSEHPTLPEADLDEPAIYIANLAAYNAGNLRGAWINPSSDKDELQEQINAAIGGNADNEWAVHDYNLFPNLGEHPSMDDITKVASLFEDYDHDAVRAAVANESNLDVAESALSEGWREIDAHEDRAMAEYAQELQEEGVLTTEFLLRYVDWERVGRDLRHDGFNVVEHEGKTFIFNK